MTDGGQLTLLADQNGSPPFGPSNCSANTLRAITLWQPWASAMASGIKRNETRSWPTSYRGDLVICSARRKPTLGDCGDMPALLHALSLPLGCALCVVEIYDCRRVEELVGTLAVTGAERDLGDYTPYAGRYAWLTRNCRRLRNPVPVVGRQLLWTVPLEISALIKENLPNGAHERPPKLPIATNEN